MTARKKAKPAETQVCSNPYSHVTFSYGRPCYQTIFEQKT